MVISYGRRDFIIDNDFIQMHKCYEQGLDCLQCPHVDDCTEEMEFVLDNIEKDELCKIF